MSPETETGNDSDTDLDSVLAGMVDYDADGNILVTGGGARRLQDNGICSFNPNGPGQNRRLESEP
jgi:hypothetical protein